MPGSVRSVARVRVSARGSFGSRSNELRQSEVEDLDLALGRHDDVGGLDVAVDDAGRMRGGQRARHLLGIAERLEQRETLRGDELVQRLARHVLHHEEVDPRLVHDVVQRDDIGMVEGGGGARLLQEASLAVRIGDLVVREDFDRDSAVQPRVARTIHLAHPARAKEGLNLIRSQDSSRGEGE